MSNYDIIGIKFPDVSMLQYVDLPPRLRQHLDKPLQDAKVEGHLGNLATLRRLFWSDDCTHCSQQSMVLMALGRWTDRSSRSEHIIRPKNDLWRVGGTQTSLSIMNQSFAPRQWQLRFFHQWFNLNEGIDHFPGTVYYQSASTAIN